MTSYVNFTHNQAARANQIILDLMKQRRFFLAREHNLSPDTFSQCISFDKTLRNLYKRIQAETRQKIEKEEKALGVTPPVLGDNQNIVTCSMYTGGLEICGMYPLQQFLAFLPNSYDELYTEIFTEYHGEEGDIPPKLLDDAKKKTKALTDRFWTELQTLVGIKNSFVLLMETRFTPGYEGGFDVFKNKVEGLVSSPEGLAYLFYKHEQVERLVKNHFVLFDTDKEKHSRVTHWSDEVHPNLTTENRGGYDCTVKFVCVM